MGSIILTVILTLGQSNGSPINPAQYYIIPVPTPRLGFTPSWRPYFPPQMKSQAQKDRYRATREFYRKKNEERNRLKVDITPTFMMKGKR